MVTCGEDIYLKMLIQDNLMHADLHPGNILIKTEHGGLTNLRMKQGATAQKRTECLQCNKGFRLADSKGLRAYNDSKQDRIS